MSNRRRGYRPRHAVVGSTVRGGFVPVRAGDLLKAWRLYATGGIELRDLRLWLASHELRAQAGFRGRDLPDALAGERLKAMTGDRRTAGRCIVRLHRLHARLGEERDPSPGYFRNLRRRVPMPRRLLVYLAGRGSRARMSAAVGHALRCLYWRGGSVVSGGTAKASCLAEALGVSLRSVRRGRQELMAIGWLEAVEVGQSVLNRHGAVVRVRSGPPTLRDLAPPPVRPRRGLAPPKNRNQLRCPSKTGTGQTRGIGGKRELSLAAADRVFHRLAARGDCPRSEAARLAVLSCAAYASRRACRSPFGLFGYLVRRGLWERATCGDEDAARRWLACRSGEDRAAADAQGPEPAASVLRRLPVPDH